MEKLCLRNRNDHMTMEYGFVLSGQRFQQEQLVFPSPSFQVKFSIYMNGNLIAGNNYNSLIERIGAQLAEASLWDSIGYDINLLVEGDVTLELKCRLLTPIQNDLQTVIGKKKTSEVPVLNDSKLNELQQVTIKFSYLTADNEVDLDKFTKGIDYLLCSWLFNIEYKFPLVFSYYGRHFFRINYNLICKTIEEMYDPILLAIIERKDVKLAKVDKDDVLLNNMLKLQRVIMSEFNIVNVLKTLDKSSYRRQVARVACFNIQSNTGTTLKNTVYRVSLIRDLSQRPSPVTDPVTSLTSTRNNIHDANNHEGLHF